MMNINYTNGNDAVFLPGKIHGCEDQVYIIYYNDQANDCEGSWEIEVLDKERILKLYNDVDGNARDFFELLPDYFQGEWYYCDNGTEEYNEYCEAYHTADFIVGRDGNKYFEMMFLVNWAVEAVQN
jgi:hypothetical protein